MPIQPTSLILVLDNVRSGHNVGAAFRLADAFAVEALYLCGITPIPPHREIRKTALGAETTVPWHQVSTAAEAITVLKKQGFNCVAVEQTSTSQPLQQITQTQRTQPTAFVFGHEVWGVSQDALQQVHTTLEIPQHGQKKSINVSTCIAIATWEWRRSSPLLPI